MKALFLLALLAFGCSNKDTKYDYGSFLSGKDIGIEGSYDYYFVVCDSLNKDCYDVSEGEARPIEDVVLKKNNVNHMTFPILVFNEGFIERIKNKQVELEEILFPKMFLDDNGNVISNE